MATQNPSLRNPFVRSQSSNSGHSGSFPSPKTKVPRREGSSGPMKENTTVVFPNISDMESLQRLVLHIESNILFAPVKSHYYRSGQKSGFVYFHEESEASSVREKMNNWVLNGATVRALTPSQFQRDAASLLPHTSPELVPSPEPIGATATPTPATATATAAPPSSTPASSHHPQQVFAPTSLAPFPALNIRSSSSLTNVSFVSGLGDATAASTVMVLRNLNFSLRNDKLLEFLNLLDISPVSVNYHFDKNGLFRGIVFVKFKTIEDAADAIEKANGQELCGRTIRAGFQRNGPGTHVTKTPLVPPGFNFSPGRRAISLILPNAVAELNNTSDPLFESVPTVLIERSSSEALKSTKENHVNLVQVSGDSLSQSAPPLKVPESSDEEICSATTDEDARGSPESSEHVWSSSRESTPSRTGTRSTAPPSAPPARPRPPPPAPLFPSHSANCRVVIHDGLEFVAVPEKEEIGPVSLPPPLPQPHCGGVVLIAGGEFN